MVGQLILASVSEAIATTDEALWGIMINSSRMATKSFENPPIAAMFFSTKGASYDSLWQSERPKDGATP